MLSIFEKKVDEAEKEIEKVVYGRLKCVHQGVLNVMRMVSNKHLGSTTHTCGTPYVEVSVNSDKLGISALVEVNIPKDSFNFFCR